MSEGIREKIYLQYLKGKTIGIFGYSTDSRDEAIFLLKNGVNVVVGLRPVDDEWEKAEAAGFTVRSLEEAVEMCDVIQVW
jgi:ketol-acid reductoisomerase